MRFWGEEITKDGGFTGGIRINYDCRSRGNTGWNIGWVGVGLGFGVEIVWIGVGVRIGLELVVG